MGMHEIFQSSRVALKLSVRLKGINSGDMYYPKYSHLIKERWLNLPREWNKIPDLEIDGKLSKSEALVDQMKSLWVPFGSNDIILLIRLGDITTHCPRCPELYGEYVLTILKQISWDKIWLITFKRDFELLHTLRTLYGEERVERYSISMAADFRAISIAN